MKTAQPFLMSVTHIYIYKHTHAPPAFHLKYDLPDLDVDMIPKRKLKELSK